MKENDRPAGTAKKRGAVLAAVLLTAAGLAWVYFSAIAPSVSYQRAERAFSDGDYPASIALYEKLNGYRDSREKRQTASAAYADSLFDSGEYRAALEYYEKLPSHSQEKLRECHYRLMVSAMENGDWESANSEYGRVIGYRDADERYPEIMVGRAGKLMEAKDYLAAQKLLNASESERLLPLKTKLRYFISLSYLEGSNGQQQDTVKAAVGFYSLVQESLVQENEYAEDAKSYLYQSAVRLYESPPDRVQALACFRLLGNYQSAAEYISEAAEGTSVPLTAEVLQGTWQCMEEGRYLITLTVSGDAASITNRDVETGESGFFWDCDGSECVLHLHPANTNGYLNPQIMIDEVGTGMNCACILVRSVTTACFTAANSETFYRIAS